ncbi:MAG: arylesterase [Microscillaceae bacterium]|nr:arylesterase [Microscillaceae bacterium]
MRIIKFYGIAFFLATLVSCSFNSNSDSEKTASQNKEDSSKVSGNQENQKVILFFGNSITAGYGLDPSEAYPARIQQKIDSLGLNYQVVNAGLSGETTAAGVKRLDWVLEQQQIDIFVLELGGNDGLRGIEPSETRKNLQQIMEKVQKKSPEIQILLTGIEVPPNMGESYASQFRNVFKEVAAAYQVTFMPFILEGVGGVPELNQADGIHPTVEGQKIVAAHVWEYLKKIMD